MPELRMDGARITYRDQGKGDALVLVHGWIGSGALWGMVRPALRAFPGHRA